MHTHALDLPILRRRPSFTVLISSLADLARPPPDFLSPVPDPLPHGTVTWLTRVISSELDWLDEDQANEIRQTASELIAVECGRSAAPSMTRSFTIPTVRSNPKKKSEGKLEEPSSIEIQIHEPTLTADSLGLKTWSTSFLLARELHHLLPPHLDTVHSDQTSQSESADSTHLHGLELGSGTGLIGIAIHLLIPSLTMTLSDYLPEITRNLINNCSLNHIPILEPGLPEGTRCIATRSGARVVQLDWTEPDKSPVHGSLYDLVAASDFMYAASHPALIVSMFRRFTKPGGLVIAGYPLRTSNRDFIQSFNEGMAEDGLWSQIEAGEVKGYDDWAGGEGVTCRWHLFRRICPQV